MPNGDLTPTRLDPVQNLPAQQAAEKMLRPIEAGYKIPALKIDGVMFPKPDSRWEYQYADGSIAFVVCRWNENGERRKHFAPLINDGGKLRWRGHPAPRPLYNAPSLVAAPSTPVLIVEGEKAAAGAAKYVPQGWVITTWAGGVNAVKQTDWSLLQGRRCVIWPDNDEAGIKAAVAISSVLTEQRSPNAIVPLPSVLPEKWDLGDPLPEPATRESVTRTLERALDSCALPTTEVEARAPEQEVIPPITAPSGSLGAYIALGTDGATEKYYFLSTESKRLVVLARRELDTSQGIMTVHADFGWWCNTFLNGQRSKDGLEALTSRESKHIGNYLRSACHDRGIFNTSRIRSRGVFMDEGHVVTHVGDQVWVDGHVVDPSSIVSNYVYPLNEPLMRIKGARPLSTSEGKQIVAVAKHLRWDHPVFADLLCGLIATAPICGTLTWRTHGIITGPKGAGKSWVLEEFVGRCLGQFAIKVLGETTAAGLRSRLLHERLPVTFDEAETNGGERGANRMDQIVDLMRSASKSTDAVVLKGSSDHSGASFALQTVFILGCIGIPIHKGADLSRTVIMTLKGAASDDDGERKSIAAHFQELNAKLATLPEDVSEKLLRRMSQMAPIVQKNTETFKKVIATKYADSRIGDQLGVLFAGRYALQYDGIIPDEVCERYLAGIDWAMFKMGHAQREDMLLLSHLAAEVVRCEGPQGLAVSRSIAELIGIASGVITDHRLPAEDARANLQRYGLRAVMGLGDVRGFIMHSSHPYLDRLFAKSDYPKGYYDIIARNPAVIKSGNMGLKSASMSIGHAGNKRPYIWIPVDLVCSGDDGVE